MPERPSITRSTRSRLNHLQLAANCLPGLLLNRRQRRLLADMRRLCRHLPALLQRPLKEALTALESDESLGESTFPESTTRELADLAVLIERRSPLGLCLRRSLVRYHYLRRLEVPVVLNFGAKLVAGETERQIAGHAWLTLNGFPYHEQEENWRGFEIMFIWPEEL